MANDDDPTRAAIRVAESVVALVRAEVDLAATRAKATSGRLALTLALSVGALFLSALALFVLVFTPVIWACRPAAAVASLGISFGLALVVSLVAAKRWRSRTPTLSDRPSTPPIHHDLQGSDHAIPR
jgi:hypothetical protein